MLSEQERQELKAVAASSKLREEFRRLSASSSLPRGERADLDQLMKFLTAMSRMFSRPSEPRRLTPIPSPRFLL